MTDIDYRAVLPEGWERPRGFAHATVATGHKIVRISGQLGQVVGSSVAAEHDLAQQWSLAMQNIASVLKAAGGTPENVVMLRAYVTDIAEFKASAKGIAEGWKNAFGKHFPAMTLVQVAGLIDPNAKVEIEAEAVLGGK